MFKEQLLNAFLQGNSLAALTESAGILLGAPVMVVDEAFRIAASFAAPGGDYEEYRTAVSHSQLSFEAAAEISGEAAEKGEDFFEFGRNGRSYRVAVLRNGGAMIGYMIIVDAGEENTDAMTAENIMFTAALISKQLCLERRRTSLDTAEDVLITLLNGDFADEEHFRLQASATFLSNFSPERFAVVAMTGLENSDVAGDMLRKSLESSFHGSHPFFYRDRIVMFLHTDHDLDLLSRTAQAGNLCIAVSPALEGIYSLGKMYGTVSRVLDYLVASGKTGFCAESRRYARLMALKGIENKSGVIAPQVAELAEYDMENSSELCLTLYTYLICHHSLKETCVRFYTHLYTVLYRMRKIKEDFGLEPELADNHFRYLFSCALVLLENGEDELFTDK